MRILKKLFYLLLILLIVLCGGIAVCAVNPGMSEAAAEILYRSGKNGNSDETGYAEKGTSKEENSGGNRLKEEASEESTGRADYDEENAGNENAAVISKTTPGNNGKNASEDAMEEYVPVPEQEIETPDNVADKNGGYQPVEGKEEELDEEQSREIEAELGTGETGDGLDFSAEFYPFYQMLDESGQHLYRQFYANVSALNDSFQPIEEVSVNVIKNVFQAVFNDHPELFWLDTFYACKFNRRGVCIEVDLHFNRTAENLESAGAELSQRADEIIAQVQGLGSDYEREREIHNILIGQIAYDIGAEMNQSIYSALINGKTVCAGYARAFQYLLQMLGIPCYYCTGYSGEDHAWNIVRLEDGYYNVDLTWDDTPGGEYDYFNKTDRDYGRTHLRRDLSQHLPACNGELYRNPE